MSSTLGVTVVVATYDRQKFLESCLASLENQDYANFEIIVVNDGSTDKTKEYLQGLRSSKITSIHHPTNQGLSQSRNTGINAAKFELVAFTDDDCIPASDWLSELIRGLTEDIDFVFGETVYVADKYQGFFPERIVRNANARWPMGNNLCYRKKVFRQIGGFDSRFDYYHNDDSEIAIRAVSQGFRFRAVPRARVYHQKTFWTSQALLRSARNPAVWVIFKKRYPSYYQIFRPPVKWLIINPVDYLHIIFMPILFPGLIGLHLFRREGNWKLFFTKWPWYPFLRRFYIYREVFRQKTLAL